MPKMATDSEMTAQTTSTMNQRGNYSRNNNSSKTSHCGLEFISWFSFMHLMKELRAYKHGCTLIKKTWPRDHVTTWPLRVDVAACNSNLRNGSRYLIIRRPKGCGFYTFPPPTPSKERRRTQLFLRFLFLVSFCSIIFCCFIFLLLLHFFVVASFFCCCFIFLLLLLLLLLESVSSSLWKLVSCALAFSAVILWMTGVHHSCQF